MGMEVRPQVHEKQGLYFGLISSKTEGKAGRGELKPYLMY